MRSFKRRDHQSLSFDEALVQVQEEARQRAVEEQAVLAKIGHVTDPLAQLAIAHAESMTPPERSVFIKSVFRQLVFQALFTTAKAEAFPERDQEVGKKLERLGVWPVMDYGSGMSYGSSGGMEDAVIETSIPQYVQPTLVFEGE